MRAELKLISDNDDTEELEKALRVDDILFALKEIAMSIRVGNYPMLQIRMDELIANMELQGFLK